MTKVIHLKKLSAAPDFDVVTINARPIVVRVLYRSTPTSPVTVAAIYKYDGTSTTTHRATEVGIYAAQVCAPHEPIVWPEDQ